MQQPPDPYSSYQPQSSPYQQQPYSQPYQPEQAYSQPYPPQQPYSQPYPPQQHQPYSYTPPAYAQPVFAAPDPLAKQRSRQAFRLGLIFGLVMGLVVALWVAYAIAPQIPAIVVGPTISLLQALPVWVIYYFAGRAGARTGGTVRTGVFTSLWATLWYLLLDLFGFIVIAIAYHDIPTFGGFGLDMVLAFVGVGIGALGASKGVPQAPVQPYNVPPRS